jgi:hypothetical protein
VHTLKKYQKYLGKPIYRVFYNEVFKELQMQSLELVNIKIRVDGSFTLEVDYTNENIKAYTFEIRPVGIFFNKKEAEKIINTLGGRTI